MWKQQSVSVVFSTFNEKDSIRKEIEDCFATGVVDEVIVVNNNAVPGTDDEVQKTRGHLVHELKQGYGHGYQRGLAEAKGDIVIMSEPDGTYNHLKDLIKLLVYSDDFPIVFGTRTTQALIHQGANMGFFMKWGNVYVAKLIEVLFCTTELSDVGCTLRLLKRSALKKIQSHFTVGGNYFSPEMMILSALERIPFVEIPVSYQQRVGKSHGASNFLAALRLAVPMVGLILAYRVSTLLRRKS